MSAAPDIAQRAEDLKTGFLGLSLALVPLLDPRLPLLELEERLYRIPATAPIEVYRQDGPMHSSEPVGDVYRRAAALHSAGFREDVLVFGAMYGATRLGDDLLRAGLMKTSEPLLQFARHLRNACAHGNRWHFTGDQPKHLPALRGRRLNSTLHGSTALFDWVGPGDYLDFLDDLAAILRSGRV